MKNRLFFTSVFLIVLSTSCQSLKPEIILSKDSPDIAQLINFELYDMVGGIRVLATSDYLKNKWKTIFSDESPDLILDKFEIFKSKDEYGNDLHFIKAKSQDGTTQVGAIFTLESSKNQKPIGLLGPKTFKCQGCSKGCDLTINERKSFCSACSPNGKCEKTELQIVE